MLYSVQYSIAINTVKSQKRRNMLLGPKKGRKKVYSLSIKNNTLRLIPISQVLVNSKFLKFMNMDSTYLYLTSLYNQYTCIIYHVQYSLAKVQYRGTTTSSWFTVISHLLFITGIIVNPILHIFISTYCSTNASFFNCDRKFLSTFETFVVVY